MVAIMWILRPQSCVSICTAAAAPHASSGQVGNKTEPSQTLDALVRKDVGAKVETCCSTAKSKVALGIQLAFADSAQVAHLPTVLVEPIR